MVLVLIDNLRADHLGAYGYSRATSPHFDAISAQGQLFTQVFAPSSWTKPSVASLFTSRTPEEHEVNDGARDEKCCHEGRCKESQLHG